MARTPRLTRSPAPELTLAAKIRVIYADTDQMGVVYHGTYARFLEAARVEFMRDAGQTYADVEAAGFALPLTDMSISYLAPARYDDILSLHVGVVEVGYARLHLGYHVEVAAGDRKGLDQPLTVAFAETHHCCIDRGDGRPARFPGPLRQALLNLAPKTERTHD
jgi:acyl-CoA thioester hydrolase